MEIPCKDCLILPICKYKTTVYCKLLNEEARKIDNDARHVTVKKWWKLVHDYIPNANTIRGSKGI